MSDEMVKAKAKLYSLILKKLPDEATDNEVNLGYYLAKGADIQKILDDARAREKREKGEANEK